MELFIKAIGTCTITDFEAAELVNNQTIKELPIKQYMPRDLRRTSARLAKMFYIAASKALEAINSEKYSYVPIITGSAMGEIEAGIKMVSQIGESKGAVLSPTLVQNSVYNAPASFLSIGFKNTYPIITLAHSFLSTESTLDYAINLAQTSSYTQILIVAGDQFNYEWVNELKKKGYENKAKELEEQNYRESAIAMLLSSDESEKTNYGTFINACVVHHTDDLYLSSAFYEDCLSDTKTIDQVIIRDNAGGPLTQLEHFSEFLNLPKSKLTLRTNQEGTALAFPLSEIVAIINQDQKGHFLFLSREYNDIGCVQYIR